MINDYKSFGALKDICKVTQKIASLYCECGKPKDKIDYFITPTFFVESLSSITAGDKNKQNITVHKSIMCTHKR